jgi:hypothetical protein
LLLAACALGVTSLGGDCDGDIVSDPTFRDWCGDELCAWTLDTGHIHPVPTWIPEDLGVSFDDTPTQISQVTSESQATCILFTSVANYDVTAGMTLLVDFNNDGTTEVTQPLPAASWESIQYEITAPAIYNGITFHIRKEGTGTAVLAEMRIQSTTGCTAAPVSLPPLLLGEECTENSQCASGVCSAINDLNVSTCGLCASGADCARGLCEDGLYEFAQCSPDRHEGAPGTVCISNSDCASDLCVGTEVVGTPDAGAPDGGGLDAGVNQSAEGCRMRETDAGIVLPGQGDNPMPLCSPVTAAVKAGTCH